MFILSVTAFAQVKVNFTGYPDVGIQYKRCFANGNTAYVDFILVNNTGKTLNASFSCEVILNKTKIRSSAFDDEGNVYYTYHYLHGTPERRLYSISLAGEHVIIGETARHIMIPTNVTLKGRIEIKDLDEYATSFNLIRLALGGVSSEYYGSALLEFRNVPITRE